MYNEHPLGMTLIEHVVIIFRRAIKEEIADLDAKFDHLVTTSRINIKNTRINRAGAENNGTYFNGQEDDGDDEPANKRRKLQDDQDVLEAEELLNKITHLSELFLHNNAKEKNRLNTYLAENREHVLNLLVKLDEGKQQHAPVDFERIKHWVTTNPLHHTLYRVVSQMIPPRSFQPEDKPRQVTLIELSHEEILSFCMSKEGVGHEKEEAAHFLERFDALQGTYRQELELIYASRDDWLGKFEATLREHAEVRFVSDDERQRVFHATKNKFDNLVQALQNKYLSQVLNLQESILMRSKKRGNLPKNATNVLKTWLFSNFLHPYPSEAEKIELSQQTNLTITQINNWFINARVRTWRPMLESMLEDKNKQNQMANMNQNMMASMQQHHQQQQQGSRVPPHQTTSSTANGSIFTTLPNFVQGGGQMGQHQPQQQQPTHRYNTRRSAKHDTEGQQMGTSFPHLWHPGQEDGASPSIEHYQQHYNEDQFGNAWHGDNHHGK
jgi:hypothetical protein